VNRWVISVFMSIIHLSSGTESTSSVGVESPVHTIGKMDSLKLMTECWFDRQTICREGVHSSPSLSIPLS